MQTSSNSAQELIKPLAHYCYQLHKFLFFTPFLVLITHAIGFSIVICMQLGAHHWGRILPVFWARCTAKAALCRVEVEGSKQLNPQQSYVIVANHQSHFDILALYGWLGVDIRWVMKQELRKVPALGIACEKLGHIFIDRSNSDRAKQSIAAAKHTLRNGTSIIFFPEGTRSETSQILPFKKGAFRLAKELNLPILPITINGSGRILPSKTLNLMPGTVQILIHPAITATNDLSEEELMQQAHRTIAAGLA